MRPVKKMDFVLFAIVVVLVTIGLLLIFSSSYYKAQDQNFTSYGTDRNQWFYLNKAVIQVGAGVLLGACAFFIPLGFFKRLRYVFLIISFILLWLVFTPMGKTFNGATRWILISGVTLMPSEWAKLALVVFLAGELSIHRKQIQSSIVYLLPYILVVGIMFGMVFAQPDLSSGLILIIIAMAMLFICGMHSSGYLIAISFVMAGWFYLSNSTGFRMARFEAFIEKSEVITQSNYQSWMSIYALSYGGIFGTGAGSGKFNKNFLPEAQSDFIMATIGEEFGFLGVMLTMILLLALIYRGVKIAMNSKDMYTCLLATGFTAMFAFQVLSNIAVVTYTIPVMGMPLPFISLGGNSMLISLVSVGFLLNISKNAQVE